MDAHYMVVSVDVLMNCEEDIPNLNGYLPCGCVLIAIRMLLRPLKC